MRFIRPLESRRSPAPKAGYGAGLQIRCLVLMRSGIAANFQGKPYVVNVSRVHEVDSSAAGYATS